jgi:hypothetical protein
MAESKTEPKPVKQDAGAAVAAKKKRHRSPAYPAINLEEAIARARTVWDEERKNAAPLESLMAHWGYKSKSSSGLLAAAALKKFGLLMDVPGGKVRQLRLTDLAFKILLDEREDSLERVLAIKTAALRPGIHRDLWGKWRRQLPSDNTIRTYLRMELDFSEQAADQFLAEYRHTISFANLTDDDTIPNDGQNDDDEDGDETPAVDSNGRQGLKMQTTMDPPPLKPPGKPSPPPAGLSQDTFTLDEGPVTLTYPTNLEHSLEDFKAWIALAVRKIERSVGRRKGSSEVPEAE